jgi:hypothetical protein
MDRDMDTDMDMDMDMDTDTHIVYQPFRPYMIVRGEMGLDICQRVCIHCGQLFWMIVYFFIE